jgi:hypothetical protein
LAAPDLQLTKRLLMSLFLFPVGSGLQKPGPARWLLSGVI